MNKSKIGMLKSISANDLSGLKINTSAAGESFSIATKIYTHPDCFSHLAEISKSFGSGCVLLLSADGIEHFDRQIVASLSAEEIIIKRLSGAFMLSHEFASAIATALPKSTKIIIATGGGAIADLAKLVAAQLNLPLCLVPSAPTNDGILSDFAITSNGSSSEITPAKAPDFVVCDPTKCKDIPPVLFRSGFGDVVSNYLAVFDWMVAKDFFDRVFIEEVAYLAISAADKAVFAGEVFSSNPQYGIELLFDALLISSAAMALARENTPCCGGEHAVAFAFSKLDKQSKFMHGEGAFLAFCKLCDVYLLFFTSYSKGKYLPPDTVARCDFLISEMGATEEKAESICKPPLEEDAYRIIQEKFRICKYRYLPNIKKIHANIPNLKNIFFSIYNEDAEKFNVDNTTLSKSIAIAPEVQDKYTTLTLMREFGLLEAMMF